MRPLILVSNDDGVRAPGLRALVRELAELGDVVVVAPDRERSGIGHAISLDRPLRVDEVVPPPGAVAAFAASGTPVDCVYLGLFRLAGRRPDLVVAGVNDGFNLGSDVFYSGTVAAAAEAALRGVPALAVSTARGADEAGFLAAARLARAVARAALADPLPVETLLNLNVPIPAAGHEVTRLGERTYRDQVVERLDMRGHPYYWIGGPESGAGSAPGSDVAAVHAGRASLTPLRMDLTAGDLEERVSSWSLTEEPPR